MNARALIDRLTANRGVIAGLLARVTEEQGHWRPAPEKWSLVEVINHLDDEERDDFRRRLDLTLRDPKAEWPPIDPEGWARERRYQDRVLADSLQSFLAERESSLRWLEQLESPDWSRAHSHPAAGSLAAGDILTSWVAHDLLHIRQIARLHWQYLSVIAEPYSAEYAGGSSS
jgi:hypothetical protein